jgi:hypothetical protein
MEHEAGNGNKEEHTEIRQKKVTQDAVYVKKKCDLRTGILECGSVLEHPARQSLVTMKATCEKQNKSVLENSKKKRNLPLELVPASVEVKPT